MTYSSKVPLISAGVGSFLATALAGAGIRGSNVVSCWELAASGKIPRNNRRSPCHISIVAQTGAAASIAGTATNGTGSTANTGAGVGVRTGVNSNIGSDVRGNAGTSATVRTDNKASVNSDGTVKRAA